MNPVVQILMQLYGLSEPEAEAYAATIKHGTENVTSTPAYIAQRNSMLAGRSDKEIETMRRLEGSDVDARDYRRGVQGRKMPANRAQPATISEAMKGAGPLPYQINSSQAAPLESLTNPNQEALNASERLRILAQSYAKPVGEIQMQPRDARAIKGEITAEVYGSDPAGAYGPDQEQKYKDILAGKYDAKMRSTLQKYTQH